MKRRDFIKRGALFVPSIFIPRLIRAQTILTADGLAAFGTNAPAGGGGGAFSPSDISGLAAWYKPESLSLSDGDPVGSWPDSSGNGNNATQASSSLKPTFKAGLVNGRNVVQLDATDDALGTSLTLTKPFTFFLVEKSSGNEGAFRRTLTSSTQNCVLAVTSRSSGNTAYVQAGIAHYQETDTAHAHIGRLALQSSTSAYFVDGTEQDFTSSVYNDWGTLAFGNSTWGEPAGCYVCEVIVYAGVTLTPTNFSNVETYLRTRWGTP